jgi:hypothetical protein
MRTGRLRRGDALLFRCVRESDANVFKNASLEEKDILPDVCDIAAQGFKRMIPYWLAVNVDRS